MAHGWSRTRRTSSSLPQPDSDHIARPAPFVSQPVNMNQSYVYRQTHAPDQPLSFSIDDGSVEASQRSFSSDLSNHPSTWFPDYASGPDSVSTSELGSARAASFLTPSTPTNSNDGEPPNFFGDASPCEHQSPHDPDRTLQGISGSNYDPGIYNFETALNSNFPYERRYTNGFNHPGAQIDYTAGISAQIPARETPIQTPWSQENRYYHGQSYPSDVVEEGPIFQQSFGYNVWLSQSMEGNRQRYEQQGLRNDSYQGYTSAQQHSQSPATGLDYTYRENGTIDNDSPGSSSSGNACSPASATTVAPRKIGKRTGPLSDDARRNAEFMRKVGCCYRCFIMREKCMLDERISGDQICQRCRTVMNNPRTWVLPCTQIGLHRRAKFVVPGFLGDQLKGPKVDAFLNDHIDSFVARSSIVLHLTMGFGEPLKLDDAVEVVLKNEEAVRMRGISPTDRGSVTLVKLNSPPILPRLTDRNAIQREFNQWLDSAIGEPDSNFPEECFPEAHEHWQREILRIICKYHQAMIPGSETSDSGSYHTLRRALKLTAFNHMMCHPWVVPDKEVGKLYRQLRGRYDFDADEWVCPRLANKIIKALLLPMLNELALRVLTDLQKLLRTKGNEERLWDPLFCTIFLCLIVVGKFQVSFLERVAVGLANDDFSFLEEDATSGIKEMESELSIHLIGQFHARFGTNRKGNGKGKMFNPLARDRTTTFSPLAKAVSHATQTYGSHIFDQNEIPHHDLGAMKEKNVTRLLASFMEHFI